MPRETYRVTPPRDMSLQTLQRFAMEINDALEAISRREAALEGRDGNTAQVQSNLQLNQNRICGVGRSQQDDEAVPRVELVDRALYARGNEHIAQFPLRVKKLKIVQRGDADDSGVPLAQIRELAQELAEAAAIGTSSDDEVLYNNAGEVDGIPNVTWDGSIFLVTSTIELDGDLDHDGSNAGFFGTAPASQPTTSQDVLDALISLGLHVAGAPHGYYGEIYGHSTANTITIAASGQANKVQVDSFDTNGESSGTTPDHTNDHITIDNAGKYMVMVNMSVESVGAGAYEIAASVFKNNGATEFEDIHTQHDFVAGGGGDVANIGLTGIADLSANDTIEVWIWNETNTNDIVVDDITLNVVRIGD